MFTKGDLFDANYRQIGTSEIHSTSTFIKDHENYTIIISEYYRHGPLKSKRYVYEASVQFEDDSENTFCVCLLNNPRKTLEDIELFFYELYQSLHNKKEK